MKSLCRQVQVTYLFCVCRDAGSVSVFKRLYQLLYGLHACVSCTHSHPRKGCSVCPPANYTQRFLEASTYKEGFVMFCTVYWFPCKSCSVKHFIPQNVTQNKKCGMHTFPPISGGTSRCAGRIRAGSQLQEVCKGIHCSSVIFHIPCRSYKRAWTQKTK